MATEANEQAVDEKPEIEKQPEVTIPGKFKRNTKGYRFRMIIGQSPRWSEVIHNLKPMDDKTLLRYQRDTVIDDSLQNDKKIESTIDALTSVWLSIIESVEGYEGIPDGSEITSENINMIPFEHINKAMTLVLADIGVLAGIDQKN